MRAVVLMMLCMLSGDLVACSSSDAVERPQKERDTSEPPAPGDLEYEAARAPLEARRIQVARGVDRVLASRSFFYVSQQGRLLRYANGGGGSEYAIAGADPHSIAVSDERIVVLTVASKWELYDASSAKLVASLDRKSEASSFDQAALDGDRVYLHGIEAEGRGIYRWEPGSAPARVLLLPAAGVTFAAAVNVSGFRVAGGDLYYLTFAPTQLFTASLNGGEAHRTPLLSQFTGWDLLAGDALVGTRESGVSQLARIDVQGRATSVSDAIKASGFTLGLGARYRGVHAYESGAARWGSWIVYLSRVGAFAFRGTDGAVFPIVLTSADGSEIPDEVHVLENGWMFFTSIVDRERRVSAVDLTRLLP